MMKFKILVALLVGLVSIPASAATVVWEPTNSDVNYSFTLDAGHSLAMFDVDDFDGPKNSPLSIDNGVNSGFDTVPIVAAGADFTATSSESGNSITLFNDDQFVVAVTDNGGNWYEPISWLEVAANIYSITFANGAVLQIDAVAIVPPSEVPVPAAVWLFGSGLLGLVGIARRKKAA